MPARGWASGPALPEVLRMNDNIPLGIACMTGATLMFAASSAIMKFEVARYPLGEVMAARSLSSLLVCAAAVLPATGLGGLRDPPAGRACRPRTLAGGFADLHRHRALVHAARGRDRHQLFRAAVRRDHLARLAQGAWRSSALRRARRRLLRRHRRHPARRGFAADRRPLRAHERRDVRQRHRRGPRHDEDRIDHDPADVADGGRRRLPLGAAGLRLRLAERARTRRCCSRAASPTASRKPYGQSRCGSRRPPLCRPSIICCSSGRS